jgi:hypothetical protein
VLQQYPADWLLTLEILELAEKNKLKDLAKKCRSRLENMPAREGTQSAQSENGTELESLISRGLEVLLD